MNHLQKLALKRIKKLTDSIEPKSYRSNPFQEEGVGDKDELERIARESFEDSIKIRAATTEIGEWVDALLSS